MSLRLLLLLAFLCTAASAGVTLWAQEEGLPTQRLAAPGPALVESGAAR
ncbi:hypothetical protein [Crenalkalicoccus roseus]|nr:hypothetical protein [Crenalkalicoccus roseus]